MTAIFISHRSTDNAEAHDLKLWLAAQGHQQLFLDFDPADGIPAGVDWEQRLQKELRRCQALLIVLTPAWLESFWCRSELAIAREKGKATFIVRVKPCIDGPVIPAIQEVDVTTGREAALAKLARGLKEHGLDPADSFDWQPGRPIFPGLSAFDVDDAAIFFGRSEESWHVVERLRRMRHQAVGAPKLLLITGASGSGKSSLMRAGVLSRLGKEPGSWIVARPFRIGADPSSILAEALARVFPLCSRPANPDALAARLAGADGAGQLLQVARELRRAHDQHSATLVLALDQAEEALAADQAEASAWLLDLLRTALARSGDELLVVATIRSDRLGAWQQHASVSAGAAHDELAFEMLPLSAMPMARIGEIVRGPASLEGLEVEDALIEAIHADTGTPDALPLLAYTLRYLHERFGAGGRLRLGDYRSFGGLDGSVRSQADAAIPIERLPEDDRQALRDAFVPGLVRATADGSFSRSRARLDSLPPRAQPYLRELVDNARLLLTDRDPQGHVTIEVAHEALLRVWPTLARWIAEDGQALRRLEALQRSAADWTGGGRGVDFLIHRDHRLADIEALVAEPRFGARLEDADREYLALCRTQQNQRESDEAEARERELSAARRDAKTRRLWLRWYGGALIVLTLLLMLVGRSLQVATKATNEATTQLDRANKATDDAKTQQAEAERQLVRANTALATSIWNDLDLNDPATLDPGELKALWKLATSGGPIQRAFVTQLWSDPERMERFARRPAMVGRALGLTWPSPPEAQTGLVRLIEVTALPPANAVGITTTLAQVLIPHLSASEAGGTVTGLVKTIDRLRDPEQLQRLRPIAAELAKRILPADAPAVLDQLLGVMRPDAMPEQLGALSLVLQGLAATLTPDQALRARRVVFDAMRPATAPEALRELAHAARALGPTLTTSEAARAMDAIGAALDAAIALDTSGAALGLSLSYQSFEALAEAMQDLPTPIDGELTQKALSSIVKALGYVQIPTLRPPSDDIKDIRAVGGTLSALAGKLTSDQQRIALTALAGSIATAPNEHVALLAPQLQALADAVSDKEAGLAFRPLLDAFLRPPFQNGDRRALAKAAVTLAKKLSSDAAATEMHALLVVRSGVTEIGAEGVADVAWTVAGRLSDDQARTMLPMALQIMASSAPSARPTLAKIIEQFRAPLTSAQAQAAIRTNGDLVQEVVPMVTALAKQLPADQVQAALARLAAGYGHAETDDERKQVAVAIAALASRLPADTVRTAVAPALSPFMVSDTDYARIGELGPLLQALPPRIASDVEQAAFEATLAMLPRAAPDYYTLHPVALMMETLAGRLNPKQTPAAFTAVIAALTLAREVVPKDVQSLSQTAVILAKSAPVDQRQAALPSLIKAFDVAESPRLRRLLYLSIIALDVQLSGEQARAAQSPILLLLSGEQNWTAFLAAADMLLGEVPAEQLSPLLQITRQGLAVAQSADDAAGWATAAAVLLRHQAVAERVPSIVQALQYPTAAGPATAVLLDALHDADLAAPGSAAGIDATLAWLRTAYPGIDLARPPACPPPPPDQRDLSCPAQDR